MKVKANPNYRNNCLHTKESFRAAYNQSIKENDLFWQEQAKRIDWFEDYNKVSDWQFKKPVHIKWFLNAKLNVSYNCIDRHLKDNANKIAFYFEPDDPKEESQSITYQNLHDEVCKLANAMKNLGVKKGDIVTIYMPMVPQAIYAMLACARIGAPHSVIFGGFSPDSIAGRIRDCDSKFVITADEGLRGGKKIPLKSNIDKALNIVDGVENVLVYKRTGADIAWNKERDHWWHEIVNKQEPECKPEIMDSEDPLFLLYTSGSTGKPKGVLHTSAGYLIYSAYSHELVFDYHKDDVYWCTADVGWITGHSYIVYGPLANKATSVIFEGVPNYPDMSRHWQIIDKYQVNTYYTAPTAIRAMMAKGDDFVKKTKRKSLRLLGSVGEPINPEAWKWYYEVVGDKNCPIVDTWWQTETGGILISPIPGVTDLKAGSATKPLPGIEPCLMTSEGEELTGEAEGLLCMKRSWPGQMRSLFGDHQRFEETYFSNFDGLYFSGDACKRDADDYYWITGRVDDVINVSGHRLGTAEIESALVAHPKVSEAAVVGFPHDIKGQGIYAYVSLNSGQKFNVDLEKELIQWVRKEIGPIATPDHIHDASKGLPKTRSGKIMRRILRKIASGQSDQLGDTSTLADPSVVDHLLKCVR